MGSVSRVNPDGSRTLLQSWSRCKPANSTSRPFPPIAGSGANGTMVVPLPPLSALSAPVRSQPPQPVPQNPPPQPPLQKPPPQPPPQKPPPQPPPQKPPPQPPPKPPPRKQPPQAQPGRRADRRRRRLTAVEEEPEFQAAAAAYERASPDERQRMISAAAAAVQEMHSLHEAESDRARERARALSESSGTATRVRSELLRASAAARRAKAAGAGPDAGGGRRDRSLMNNQVRMFALACPACCLPAASMWAGWQWRALAPVTATLALNEDRPQVFDVDGTGQFYSIEQNGYYASDRETGITWFVGGQNCCASPLPHI